MPKQQTPTEALVIGLLLLAFSLMGLVLYGLLAMMFKYMPQEIGQVMQQMNLQLEDLPRSTMFISALGSLLGLVTSIPLLMGRNLGRLLFTAFAVYTVVMKIVSRFMTADLSNKLAEATGGSARGMGWFGILTSMVIMGLGVWLLNRRDTRRQFKGYKGR